MKTIFEFQSIGYIYTAVLDNTSKKYYIFNNDGHRLAMWNKKSFLTPEVTILDKE